MSDTQVMRAMQGETVTQVTPGTKVAPDATVTQVTRARRVYAGYEGCAGRAGYAGYAGAPGTPDAQGTAEQGTMGMHVRGT